jgi:hypothetical protein
MTRAVDSGLTNLCPRLIPDGAIVLTTPSGRSHITTPTGCAVLPAARGPHRDVGAAQQSAGESNHGLAMPTRKHTRTQDRAARIEYERGLNRAATPPTHHPCDF